jgi:hypothetical protein
VYSRDWWCVAPQLPYSKSQSRAKEDEEQEINYTYFSSRCCDWNRIRVILAAGFAHSPGIFRSNIDPFHSLKVRQNVHIFSREIRFTEALMVAPNTLDVLDGSSTPKVLANREVKLTQTITQ